ncbi:hypothetical protein IAD21_00057 [Abditibacteriota bacterium]|nr:hypothetical protein IAD21_00057 [Abditibacteriota bacterium]
MLLATSAPRTHRKHLPQSSIPVSTEQFPIERPVINGLRDVMHLYLFSVLQVSNGLTHFEKLLPISSLVILRVMIMP